MPDRGRGKRLASSTSLVDLALWRVAAWLAAHPKVTRVSYLGMLPQSDPAWAVFRMLDALQVIKLAVSLGGTDTLISHPASTTHSGVSRATRHSRGSCSRKRATSRASMRRRGVASARSGYLG
jgi:cystathionine beta-lyase/cystathionine gamma-synthase